VSTTVDNHILVVQNLTKSFGGLVAVDDASFEVRAETITGLIGPNGAGKSTMLNLISGFEKPGEGEVRLRGVDIAGKRPPAVVGAGLGRTFQDPRVFPHLSVMNNVLVAAFRRVPRKDLNTAAVDALEQVGLAEHAAEPAGSLSYGDQKLLSVARLLAANVDVLLLDEPLAGVALGAVDELLEVFRTLRRNGKTLLLVEHNMEAVMRGCDHVVVLDFGKVIATGPPDEIMANADVIKVYLGS